MMFGRTRSLDPAEVATRMRGRDLQLIDVRERREVTQQPIKGAIHIPLRELSTRWDELDRGATVAFVCHSGARSRIATRRASKAGFDAVNVRGGVMAWSRAGLPLGRR